MKANLSNRPPIARVREVLDYDPVTGVLRWKITSGRAVEGQEAGCLDKTTGYRRVWIDGVLLLCHHVIWAIAHSEWPERLDHIYGKAAGNRLENLRLATQAQNTANKGKQINNKSGFKGVCKHKASGKWIAQLGKKYLGIFDTPEEGAIAYEEAAIAEYGEFARGVDFIAVTAAAPVPKRARGRPTPEEVRELLSYDPMTGDLRWKRALGFRGQVGSIAGRLNTDGYRRIGIFYGQYAAHILAWVIITGIWPTKKIDHKNNERDDNRWVNLREATQSQNIANAKSSGRNTSGYRGVSEIKGSNLWGAWIKVDGKSRRIGAYSTAEAAYAAYCREARRIWGEFARTD